MKMTRWFIPRYFDKGREKDAVPKDFQSIPISRAGTEHVRETTPDEVAKAMWVRTKHIEMRQVGPNWYDNAVVEVFKHRAEDFANPLTVRDIVERLYREGHLTLFYGIMDGGE